VNAVTKLDSGELMALKRMEKFAVLQSGSHLKMVWIERKIMSLTASPFLCNLLYAFENERELFLVMPFMQGGDLRFHLKERGPMPIQMAQFYACEMILGLQALHSARVVFRDLKPDNMLSVA
jgi:serine/threonine protein kinase